MNRRTYLMHCSNTTTHGAWTKASKWPHAEAPCNSCRTAATRKAVANTSGCAYAPVRRCNRLTCSFNATLQLQCNPGPDIIKLDLSHNFIHVTDSNQCKKAPHTIMLEWLRVEICYVQQSVHRTHIHVGVTVQCLAPKQLALRMAYFANTLPCQKPSRS